MASFLHNGPGRPRVVCAATPLRLTPLNQTRPTDWTEEPRRSSAFTRTRTHTHTPRPEPPPPLCFSCRTTKTPFVLIENGCFGSNGIAHQSRSCPSRELGGGRGRELLRFPQRHVTCRQLGGKCEESGCPAPSEGRGGHDVTRRFFYFLSEVRSA